MIEATFENFVSIPMPDYEELVRAAEKARIISQAVIDNLPMNGEWLRCICGVQRTEGDTVSCKTEAGVAAAPVPVADSEAPHHAVGDGEILSGKDRPGQDNGSV